MNNYNYSDGNDLLLLDDKRLNILTDFIRGVKKIIGKFPVFGFCLIFICLSVLRLFNESFNVFKWHVGSLFIGFVVLFTVFTYYFVIKKID